MGNVRIDNTEIAGNYTIVYNAIYYDNELSPEAQGIFGKLCSLPPWTQISIEFLCGGCKCGENKMGRIINELIEHGYITRTHDKDPETGAFTGYTYTMHKDPKGLISGVATAPTAEAEKAEKPKKAVKHKHGEFKHVMLTDKQYSDLIKKHGEAAVEAGIKYVDEYCETNGKTYKNYSLVLTNWGIDAAKRQKRNYRPAQPKTPVNPFMTMLEGEF